MMSEDREWHKTVKRHKTVDAAHDLVVEAFRRASPP